jgi:hypothetical protein
VLRFIVTRPPRARVTTWARRSVSAAVATFQALMKIRTLVAVLFSSQIVAAALAFAANERTVSIAGHKLKVSVPAGYSFESTRDEEGGVLVAMENPVWEISIIARVAPEPDPKCTTSEWQEQHLVTIMADALSQSKEMDYNFKPFKTKSGATGTYCIFTDPTLKKGEPHKPNDYVNMTGGLKASRGYVVAFKIMSNDVNSPEYREAFALFTDGFEE